MKLINGAELSCRDNDMILRLGGKSRAVKEADRYIFLAVTDGGIEDSALIELVATREKICEITAELRLAQLVLDYGEYLAPADIRIIDA
ncbi:MAG: hypothetical protein IJU78_07710 [Clostridia bacterium]|nr:hypothetical protein [Clostridia bacterium]